jgi:hypothetical protein
MKIQNTLTNSLRSLLGQQCGVYILEILINRDVCQTPSVIMLSPVVLFLLIIVYSGAGQTAETNEIDKSANIVENVIKEADNNLISNEVEPFLNYGYKKPEKTVPTAKLVGVTKSKVELLSRVFKKYIEDIKNKYKKVSVLGFLSQRKRYLSRLSLFGATPAPSSHLNYL